MFLKNAWYVAAWANEVAGNLLERTILETPVCIYRKQDGTAVAIDNRCPHRFAPLSMGKRVGDDIECPYHGLRFNAEGQCVHNPHGDKIPKKACVKSYTTIERDNLIWIWMGEPELADPDTIPDYSCHTDSRFATVCGVIEMQANYQLIVDNLMDLTHVEYIHEGILGSEAISRGLHEVIQQGTTVYSNRWCPDGLAPPAWGMMFNNYEKPVDHWLYMRWDAPCHLLLDVGITPVGRPRDEGIWVYGTDILTPKDAKTTYYFWGVTRSYEIENDAAGEAWVQAIDMAFDGQDRPMIEAQQRMMGDKTFDELDPVLLISDSGSMRVRRILTDLIEKQTNGAPPEPALLSLNTLLDESCVDNGVIKPVV